MICYKIFTALTGDTFTTSIKYVSGKRMIHPASEVSKSERPLGMVVHLTMHLCLQAARDALEKMGNKKFYEQLLQDIMQQEHWKITHESDVITLKDYMQVRPCLRCVRTLGCRVV